MTKFVMAISCHEFASLSELPLSIGCLINLPANLVRERAARSDAPIDWLEVIRNVAEDVYGDVERRDRAHMAKRLALDDRYDF